MNRLQYRIVFNKQRGQLMAVAETARGRTKSPGESDAPAAVALTAPTTTDAAPRGPPTLMAVAAALATGALLTLMPPALPTAHAQVVADPSAPKSQQPTVITAPNGTPLVNIQTPSASGVSRNTYRQFDVNAKGVILNNSRGDTSTQLGGWVQANPWLGKGEAKVILNEVNSSSPTQLKGFIEIAGRRAELVIANPSGIQVDGAGFINASSATLTTGTPRFGADGAISGYAVQGGLLRIDGAGLDASQTDYTALLARAVEINAGLWARDVHIATGAQVVDAQLAATGEAVAATGEAPRYGLDSTALGGIYAQRITLVGTEAGLGVRQAGQMVAGQLTLNASGWLDNTGTLYAQQADADGAPTLMVQSGSGVRNGGWMASRGSAEVRAPQWEGQAGSVTAAGMNADGALVGGGHLSVTATESATQAGLLLTADQLSVRAARVDLGGAQAQARAITVGGQAVSARGALLLAGDRIDVAGAAAIDLTRTQAQAGEIAATAPTLTADGALLSATGTLGLRADGALSTQAASLAAGKLSISARDVDLRQAEWLQLGTDALSLRMDGTMQADGARIASNGADLDIAAGTLSAARASVEHYGSGHLALSAITQDLRGAFVTTGHGLSISGAQLQLDGADLLTRTATIQAVGALSLSQALVRSAGTTTLSADVIDHRGGRVLADGGLTVAFGSGLNNEGGQLQSAQGDVTLTATSTGVGAGTITNRAGLIAARDELQLSAAALVQAEGAVLSARDVQVRLSGALTQEAGSSIGATGALDLQAGAIDQRGTLRAGDGLSMRIDGDAALAGSIHAGGALRARSGGDMTVTGLLGASGDATLQAGGRLTSSTTGILAAGLATDGRVGDANRLSLQAGDDIALRGQLLAGRADLAGAGLDLSAAQVGISHGLALASDGALITEGVTLNTGSLSVIATDWRNAGGRVAVSGTGAWRAALTGQLDNRQGVIQTNSADVGVAARDLDNTGGVFTTSGASLRMTVDELINRGGQLGGTGAVVLIAGSVDNRDGQISGHDLRVEAARIDNTGAGLIAAAGAMRVDAASLQNAGSLQSRGDLQLGASDALTNSGLIRAFGQADVQAGVLTHTGTLAAQGALSVMAHRIDSTGAFAAGLREDNTLAAQGDLTLRADTSLQHGGTALAAGHLSVSGASLALQETQMQGTSVALNAGQGDLRLDRAKLASAGLLDLRSGAALDTSGATLSGASVTLVSVDWRHVAGQLAQTDAAGQFTAQISGRLDNSSGVIQANAGMLSLSAQTLINTAGEIQHAGIGELRIDVDSVDGTRGKLLSNGAITVRASDLLALSQARTQGRGITLSADRIDHQGAQTLAQGDLQVTTVRGLDNSTGLLQSTGNATLSAGTIQNRDGQIDGQEVTVGGGALLNGGQGLVNARGALTLDLVQLTNAGAVQSGGESRLTVSADLTNIGLIRAQGPLGVTAGGTLTHTGSITAVGNVTVDAGTLASSGVFAAGLRNDNSLAATGDLTLRTTDALQHGGQAIAAGALSVDGASLQLQEAQLQAQRVTLAARGGDLRLDRALVNSAGQLAITAAGAVDTRAASLTGASVSLDATDWSHVGGRLAQTATDGALNITVANRLDNTDGQIGANARDLGLSVLALDNTRGQVVHAGTGALTLSAQTLSGRQGQVLSAGALDLTVSGAADLRGATTQGQGLAAAFGSLQHQGGKMLSGGALALTVDGAVDNTGGQLVAVTDLRVDAGSLDNRDGQIGGRAIDLIADVFSNGGQGLVSAQGGLTLSTGQFSNAGSLQAIGDLTLSATGAAVNTGSVYTQGIGRVTVGGLLTNAGTLAAQGALTVQADAIGGAGTFAAGLKPDNTLSSQGDLTLRAQQALQAGGTLVTGGALSVSGATLQLQDSRLQAAQATLSASAGDLRLDRAVLASAGALSLTSTGGTLSTDNASVSGSSVTLDAAAWRHAQGTLTQTGANGALLATIAGALNNQGGQIQANGTTLRLQAQDVINTQGRIAQAAAGALRIDAGSLSGADGQILTQGALTIQATGAADLSRAVTQGRGVTIDAATLTHRGGQLLSTDALTLTTAGQLDNSGGTVVAAGPLALRAGSLVNGLAGATGGLVQGDGSVLVDVDGTLDNQGGKLRAGGQLTLDAARLDNRSGWAGADGAMNVITAGELLNAGGSLLSQGTLTVHAGSVGNQQGGRIASLASAITVRSAGQMDNAGGHVLAAQGLTLSSAGLVNRGGELSGSVVGVDTRGQGLDNQGGRLLATQALTVDSGALENRGGLLQSGGDLTVRTHGAALNNARDAAITTPTGLRAQGVMTLDSGSLFNEAGISAGGAVQINTGTLTNRGEIGAGTTLRATVTEVLDNRGGRLIGTQSLEAGAQQMLNQGGLMYGAQALTVRSAGVVDNTDTTGANQGLQGGQVTLQAQRMENRGGQVLASGDLSLTISQSLDNAGGQLGASGSQTIGDGLAPNTTALSVNNGGGRIWSGGALGLTARELAGGAGGQISSGGHLSVTLQGDYTYGAGSQWQSGGDTTLTITGQFTNQGVLRSGGVLSVGAAGIDNQASGELSGRVTLLSTAGTLTNRGLIDGDGVSVTADRVLNLGTGRIYGGDIVLTGGSLENGAEGGVAAVIAGRATVDGEFSGDISNRDGALIFADGDLRLTGRNLLNENATIQSSGWMTLDLSGALTNSSVYQGLATGQGVGAGVLASKAFISSGTSLEINAASVLNSGATIEARNDLWMSADAISNVNPYLMWRGGNSTGGRLEIDYYRKNQTVEYVLAFVQLNGRTPQQALADWRQANPDKVVHDWRSSGVEDPAVVTQSTAGRIIVGGTLNVQGTTITNDMGMVVGATGVAITGAQVNNVNRQVTVVEAGTGAVKQVAIRLPASAQSFVPVAAAPGGRGAAGLVSPGTGASAQTAQGTNQATAGGAGQLNGMVNGAIRQITRGDGNALGSAVNAAWRAGAGTALQAVYATEGASLGLSAQSVTRSGRDAVVAALRDAAATRTDASADGRARIANAAQAVSAGGRSGTQGPTATNGVVLVKSNAQFNGKPLARNVLVNLSIPTNSLFKTKTDPTSRYLVETDPRFANYRDWLSSDYLLEQLAVDPATTQKRLGDGFYEQRLVREQLGQLTGTGYLPGYASDEAMYRALLGNGASFGKAHQLVPGVALTAEQMTQLTTDLVWLVEQEVTLADGTTQRVLVPQVYLVPRDGDLEESGSLIAGGRVQMALSGDLNNAGTVRGGDIAIDAQNIANAGAIRGTSVALSARDDLSSLGGELSARQDLSLAAGRDIVMSTTTAQGSLDRRGATVQSTVLDQVATLQAGGVLVMQAGRDISLQTTQITQGGANGKGADGGVVIQSGRDITMTTLATGTHREEIKNANNYKKETVTQDVGTTIAAQGEVVLKAGQDLTATAADISSAKAGVTLAAGGDVSLLAGEANQVIEQMTQKKKSGLLKKKVTTTYSKTDETTAIGTTVSGETVEVLAEQDIRVVGGNVVSDLGTTLVAGRDVTIEGATNTLLTEQFKETKKSGLMSGGGIGFTIGKQSLAQTTKGSEQTNAAATVASVSGDVTIVAGGAYKQVGSDITAPGGDVSIEAQSIDILESRNKQAQETETKFKQSGLTLSLSAPGLSAATGAISAAEHTIKTEDDRMKALAAATAVSKAMQALDEIKKFNDLVEAEKQKSVSISLTIGSSQSKSTQTNQVDEAAGSNILAGGALNLTAKGAADASNVTVRGGTLSGQDVAIKADNAIQLLASSNSSEQHSKDSSSSASIGVAASLGSETKLGYTASASVSKGHSDGVDNFFSTTQITGGTSVTLQSGGDTALKGAVVTAPKVVANVGGDLKIESLQDTASFDSKSQSLSGSVTVGAGAGGNVSYSQSKVSADYAAVGTQAGIRAGDEGFQVDVKGNTDLKGGAITSSQAAIDAAKNSLSTGTLTSSDIDNRSQYSASAVTVSAGTSGGMAGAYKDSGDERSTTKSTISAGSTTITSGDAASQAAVDGLDRGATNDATAGKLAQGWDGQKLAEQSKLNAQIVAEFGAQASKEVGDFAERKLQQADKLFAQAAELDPESDQYKALIGQARQLESEWGDQGTLRVAAHAVIGGLTGDLTGAAGAVAGTLTAPEVAAALEKSGIDPALSKGLTALASTAVGSLVGGEAGGVAALNEVANNFLDHAQASRLRALQKKLQDGTLTKEEAAERNALILLDTTTNAQLKACGASRTPGCLALQQKGAEAAKSYLPSASDIETWAREKAKTGPYTAAQLMDAYNLAYTDPSKYVSKDSGPVDRVENWIRETLVADLMSGKTDMMDKVAIYALTIQRAKLAEGAGAAIIAGQALVKGGSAAIGKPIAAELPPVAAAVPAKATCSFRGDMQVQMAEGFRPIESVRPGDWVLAKDERTGEVAARLVLAQYSNPYRETVYLRVVDEDARRQTIVSNLIHPFFVMMAGDEKPAPSSEGHRYAGSIEGGAWVDAANLQSGFKLLGASGRWLVVEGVSVTSEALQAFNLTVDGFHTYFVRAGEGEEAVWVHNDCWNSKPPGATQSIRQTPDGRPIFEATGTNGNKLDVYQGTDGRWYNAEVYPPTQPNAAWAKVEPRPGASVPAPQKAIDVAKYVEANGGAAPPGYRGGGTFQNDGRGSILPRVDDRGVPITYREYDVNPFTPGINRGTERLVVGSNGQAYYTDDHYAYFIPVKKP